MTYVLLGNTAPLMADGTPAQNPDGSPLGNTITFVALRDDIHDADEAKRAMSTRNDPILNRIKVFLDDSDDEHALAILEVNDLWNAAHSADLPEWVQSDDSRLQDLLAEWFSGHGHDCGSGRPGDWEMADHVKAGLAAQRVPGFFEEN